MSLTQRAFAIGLIEKELDRDEGLLRKQQEGTEQDKEEEQDEGLSGAGEAPVSKDSPEDGYVDEPEDSPAVGDSEGSSEPEDEEELGQDMPAPEFHEGEHDDGLSGAGEAPVSEDSPEDGYVDEPEESAAVGDSEAGSDPEDEEELEQDMPAPEYVEGELGAAIEVAPNFDYGQDEPPGFPEPDDEEEAEDFGLNMAM